MSNQPNHPNKLNTSTPASTLTLAFLQNPSDSPEEAELQVALTRAIGNKSDTAAIIQLDRILRTMPHIYRDLGDLAAKAQIVISSNLTEDTLTRESILVNAEELRANLTRPTDTQLEELLVEQCVNAYMLHYDSEIQYSRYGNSERNNVWDTRLTASQKRFINALESLARLRQLALPVMQINIAETQTNIAAPTTDP